MAAQARGQVGLRKHPSLYCQHPELPSISAMMSR
jgi:hypothetical protein